MKFTDFEFNEGILKGIEEAGFTDCMPVQAETFQTINQNRDVFAQSQTGTGKTAAFLISIFQLLMEDKHFKGKKALIIVPTRELAVQIEKEAAVLGKHLDFRIGSFYGGVGYNTQEEMLEKGVDILIGTPGRLIDFSKSGKIRFNEIGILVIDEADRLFDMGFLPDLRKILSKMIPTDERRTMLFSATLNAKVGNLAWEYMNNPGEVVIEPEQVTVEAIQQELYHVGADEKMKVLLGLLKRENPETAIIFANTKHASYEVAKRLEHNGYPARCLMGDLPQKKRLKIVEDTKEGKVRFLVATDVAARGLHINDLSMVVNYDVPSDAESYVHRIGRTARAGKSGKAYTLACEKFVYGLPAIEKLIGQKIPVFWVDEDLMVEDKSQGMRFHFDKRAGSPQDSRTGRGSSRTRQHSRKFNDNRRPLDARAARVQSEIMAVSGSLDTLGEDNQKDSVSGSDKNRRRKNYRNPRSTDNRSRNRKDYKAPASMPMERVSSENTIEDRLAYYKAKYGEDFKADENVVKNEKKLKSGTSAKKRKPQGSRSDTGRNGSGSGRNAGQQNRQGGGQNRQGGGQNRQGGGQNRKTGSAAPSTAKKVQKPVSAPARNAAPQKPEKKKGLLTRLFGKKSK